MFTIINSVTIILEVQTIKKKQTKAAEVVFPSEEEMKAAQLACCGRYCNECETPAAYAWRKREVDMALLLEKAIAKELSQTEREVVIEHWFNSLSQSQIAQKRGTSSAAVKGTIDRATQKLERVLGYAVCYQQNVCTDSIIPLVVGRARVIAAARNAAGGNSGNRLLRLRQSQCLTKEALSKVTGIKLSRIISLESEAIPKGDELILLSEFFGVTADFILKGESDGK